MFKKKVKIFINLPCSFEKSVPRRSNEIEDKLALFKNEIRAIEKERFNLLKDSILSRPKGRRPNKSIGSKPKIIPQLFSEKRNNTFKNCLITMRNKCPLSPIKTNVHKKTYSPISKLRSVALDIIAEQNSRFSLLFKY